MASKSAASRFRFPNPFGFLNLSALNEADLQNLNIDHMNSITENEVACRVTNTLIDTGQ